MAGAGQTGQLEEILALFWIPSNIYSNSLEARERVAVSPVAAFQARQDLLLSSVVVVVVVVVANEATKEEAETKWNNKTWSGSKILLISFRQSPPN